MSTQLRSNRAFVTLAAGQVTRGMGFWLAWIGMISLATFTLNASPSKIALIIGSTSIPHIVLGPLSGTLVDRTNPKWVLFFCFVAGAGVTSVLAVVNAVWQILCIVIAWSVIGTLIWPAQGALTKALVSEGDLRRANGVMGACWEVTLIAGPALSGALAKWVSPRAPMIVGAIVFAAGAAVIATMPFTHAPDWTPPERTKGQLREGLRVMFGMRDLRVLVTWGAFAWGAFNVLIAVEPVLVRQVLGGQGQRLGLLYTIGGVGSTTAALAIGWFAFGRRELLVASAGLGAVGFFFALYAGIARWPAVAPIQAFIGAGFAVYATLTQALIQRRSSPQVVGRAIAAKRQVEETAGFIGSIAGGAFAGFAGPQVTLVLAGGLMAATALVMMWRARSMQPAESVGVTLGPVVDPIHEIAAPALALPEAAD